MGEFETHPKFAFVPAKYPNRYVTDGKQVGEVADFYAGYDYMKLKNFYLNGII